MERQSPDSAKRLPIPDDLIRTLAIFLVVLLHASNEVFQSTAASPADWWTAVIYKSISLPCVPLFVLLSGALLLQPEKLNEPLGVFLKKRLTRLGLAFVFWSVVYLFWGFYVTGFPVTLYNIVWGLFRELFSGAYYQFWFIYLIAGLYLITPILRYVVGYGTQRVIQYLIGLWFLGVAVAPLLRIITTYILNETVFLLGGFIGYFVLGYYLLKIKVRSSLLYGMWIGGVAASILGVWLLTYPFSAVGESNYFFGYLTISTIASSVALYMILLKFRPDWPGPSHPKLGRFVQAVSKNTLPIFLFHVIILESFQRGFFGFTLSFTTLNPIVEIPLLATLTFLITFGLVLLMKQVPVLKKLIG